MQWYQQEITVLIAHPQFIDELKIELEYKKLPILHQMDRFFAIPKSDLHFYWASNIWQECKVEQIESINDGIKKLKALNRNWDAYTIAVHRRAEMILKGLPFCSKKPIKFLGEVPPTAMGGFTLVDNNTLIYSVKCTSPFGNGDYSFDENKTIPPSRAYLKLWEFFTLTKLTPKKDLVCFDVGSSPGGWSWVLSTLDTQVMSFDKADLAPEIAKLSNIKHFNTSAFGLEPKDFEKVDWIFSDIICYPERLLQFVHKWLDSGKCKNFVTTIKFQGPTDYEIMQKFLEIEGSNIIHLYHNKHEVTWYYIGDPTLLRVNE